jgi:thioesterase domain-containing protein
VAPSDLEQYLYEKIPLSRAIQISAIEVNEGSVCLRAPLAPNMNHRATVFGGSAVAVAILSAWSLLHVRLHALRAGASIVIQRHSMSYDRPMHGDFDARATLAAPEEWPRFVRTLQRWGKARICVNAVLEYGDEQVGVFNGEFVAFVGEQCIGAS